MKLGTLTLLLISGLAAACFGQAPPAVYDDSEAYAVYAVILGRKVSPDDNKRSPLIIEDQTTDYPTYGDESDACLKPEPASEPTFGPLITAYRALNKKPWLLQDKFNFPFKYQLVPRATIDAFFEKKNVGGWEDFYKRFPRSGGYVYVSAVGFNPDRTLAMVYAGHSCGGLCGGGGYRFLKKVDGKWTEINFPGQTCTWVS
jgi:hypothetical protein